MPLILTAATPVGAISRTVGKDGFTVLKHTHCSMINCSYWVALTTTTTTTSYKYVYRLNSFLTEAINTFNGVSTPRQHDIIRNMLVYIQWSYSITLFIISNSRWLVVSSYSCKCLACFRWQWYQFLRQITIMFIIYTIPSLDKSSFSWSLIDHSHFAMESKALVNGGKTFQALLPYWVCRILLKP